MGGKAPTPTETPYVAPKPPTPEVDPNAAQSDTERAAAGQQTASASTVANADQEDKKAAGGGSRLGNTGSQTRKGLRSDPAAVAAGQGNLSQSAVLTG